ncbi:hypothetical protein ACEPAG_339 [Sanghuangporus baumii]
MVLSSAKSISRTWPVVQLLLEPVSNVCLYPTNRVPKANGRNLIMLPSTQVSVGLPRGLQTGRLQRRSNHPEILEVEREGKKTHQLHLPENLRSFRADSESRFLTLSSSAPSISPSSTNSITECYLVSVAFPYLMLPDSTSSPLGVGVGARPIRPSDADVTGESFLKPACRVSHTTPTVLSALH